MSQNEEILFPDDDGFEEEDEGGNFEHGHRPEGYREDDEPAEGDPQDEDDPLWDLDDEFADEPKSGKDLPRGRDFR